MATNFPASLDTLTNPTSSDSLSSPSHSAQHANVNDAVEALQAKVGADSSAVTSSHDYKIADHASRLTTLEGRDTAGLVLVSRTTIGSAVSSVTVSNAFSTDYDNYKILVSGGVASTNGAMRITLGATVTGYAYQQIYGNYGGSLTGIGNSGTATAMEFVGLSWTTAVSADVDLNGPFLTTRTFYRTYQPYTTTIGWVAGYLNNATSYTDFTLAPAAGTITGGHIDVYGYAKA